MHERTIAEAVHNPGLTGQQLVRPDLEEPGLIGEATRARLRTSLRLQRCVSSRRSGSFSECGT